MLKHKLHTSSRIRSCSRTELSILSLHMQRTYSRDVFWHEQTAKVLIDLRIRAVSSGPLLLTRYTGSLHSKK